MKKHISIWLAFLLAVMPISGLWTSVVHAAYAFSGGGNGSLSDPYIILTAEDLDHVRDNMTANYKLGADIDLSDIDNWEPIGGDGAPFRGVFDGDFHTIRGMTIHSAVRYVGMFGQVHAVSPTTPSIIKNVRLEDVEITSTDITSQVGGLVGVAANNTSIEGVSVSGVITSTGFAVGGAIGQTMGRVAFSEAHVSITGSARYSGGLIGVAGILASVEQSYATGNLTMTGGELAGGLIGQVTGTPVANSYALGRIELPGGDVGGLIGQVSPGRDFVLTNSYAAGSVHAGGGSAGGLVGAQSSGFPSPTVDLINSYWNDTEAALTAIGDDSSREGAASVADLMRWDTYENWDAAIWGIREGESMPYLKRFAPEIRIDALASSYGTSGPDNVLQVTGTVRDGSVGERLAIGLKLNNWLDATVAEAVYTLHASGLEQPFDWSVTFDELQYPAGSYHLVLTVEDTVGDNAYERTFFFDINDTTAPAAPTLSGPADGARLNDAAPTISGTAEPHSEVTIVVDGADAGTVTAGADGSWEWTVTPALDEGSHTVAARAEDAAGNVGAVSAGRTFTVDVTVPDVPTLTGPVEGARLNDAAPTISGMAEPHSEVTIVVDGADAGTVTAGADGSWEWTVAPALDEGSHTVAARAEDAAGNVGAVSAGRTFTVDVTVPDAPVLTGPAEGARLNDAAPTISGMVEPHSEVTIVVDGADAGTVTAGADGSWEWTVTPALDEGSHTVAARAEDAAGNVGAGSPARTFTVDISPPIITLHGAAAMTIWAGDSFVDPSASAVDDLDGDVPVTVAGHVDQHAPGTYELTYSAQDGAGNFAAEVKRTVRVNARSPIIYLSGNAELKELLVTGDGKPLKSTPPFVGGTSSYHLDTSARQIEVQATTSHAGAVATLQGERLPASGVWAIPLAEGDNAIEIKVTAENGTTQTYLLTIVRHADPTEPPACAFRDIAGHWAEELLCEAARQGIVEGDAEGYFHPQRPVTRIEYAAMLLRTLKAPSDGEKVELAFTDAALIPAWALDTAKDAVNAGLMEGYPDGTLRPLQTVSRSEMAAMMGRARLGNSEDGAVELFADDDDIPEWARAYIYHAAKDGILTGRGSNQFVPKGLATRAEAAVSLLRLRQLLQ